MRAALYRRTGGPEALSVEEVPTPEPGPGQVRVRMAFSGVNPTDWKSRSGATGGQPEGFQVPHHDGAGVVDALGDGVAGKPGSPALGQRVWTYLAAAGGNRFGTAAEYSVLPVERVVALPDSASDELGASLGVPALTAAHCLGGPGGLAGRCVLVAAGAGAVGHYAIELAKFAGARVVATVSTAQKAELALAAGADCVVNYREEGAAEKVVAFGRPDRIVEVALGANLDLDLAVSRPGTQVVVYASEASDPVMPTRRLMGANISVGWVLLYGAGDERLQAAARWTADALAGGALSLLPLHVYPLDEVAAAQGAVEKGAVGKVLVSLAPRR